MPETVIKVDTFPGQGALQQALLQQARLVISGRTLEPGRHTLSREEKAALCAGHATLVLPESLHRAIEHFSQKSEVPLENMHAAALAVARDASLSSLLDDKKLQEAVRGQGAVHGQGSEMTLAVKMSEGRAQDNPLHATRCTVRLDLAADAGGPVVWNFSRMARASWELTLDEPGGGQFIIAQLTDQIKEEAGIYGPTLYYIDTLDLNETSEDLRDVRVYLDPSVYGLFNDDDTIHNNTLVRTIACDLVAESAQKLITLAREDTAACTPLLRNLLKKGGLIFEDTKEGDEWQARFRAQLQAEMALADAVRNMYTAAGWPEGDEDV